MIRKTVIYLLLALCLPFAFSSCHRSAPIPVGPLQTSLDSLFGTMFDDDEPGAIVLVAKGDSVIYSCGFGLADLSDATPMSDTSLLNICSISKQFSAIALLKLQEEGLLSLDDSLPKFFPEFTAPFYNKITLRHLLSHTSGIPDTRPRTRKEWNEYVVNHNSSFSNVRDFKLYGRTAESISYLTTLDTLDFEPGTAYEYENPTYQLALPIIESVTGMEFCAWMDSAIFKPAGMMNTVYLRPEKEQPQLAHAYKKAEGPNRYNYYRSDDDVWEEYDYGEADFFPTKADGGLYTSAREFLAWERALFGRRIVGEESLKQAFHSYIDTDIPNTGYGLGFFIEKLPDGKKIYHTGDNGGYLTVEAYFPKEDLFYLVFANRPDWDREGTVAKVDSILLKHGWLESTSINK